MKTFMFVCLMLSGCSAFAWKDPTSPEQLAKVKNFHRCSADLDCDQASQHCGFSQIDTVAVCLDGPSGSSFGVQSSSVNQF